NIVVNPSSIEIASRDKVKTDKRDALKIATQLSTGRLRCVFVPTQEREEKRSMTRLRSNVLSLRHRVGQQFKSLLFTQGLIDMADDTAICEKWILKKLKEVVEAHYTKDFYYSLNQYAELWIHLTKQMKEIEAKLNLQAEEDKVL